VKTDRCERRRWNQILLHCHLGQSPLLPHTPPGEERLEHQTKNLRSKLSQSLAFLILFGSRPCCNKWCIEIRSSRKLMYRASHLHHLHPLPFIPPSDKEERYHFHQSKKFEVKKLLRRWADSFKIPLFIDEGTKSLLIQILNHLLRVGSNLNFFGMSNQSDMIYLCHTISVIVVRSANCHHPL